MAIQFTSMTKRPGRLLDKGPNYFRQQNHSGIFTSHRISAVELLEATKPQYVKSSNVLDHRLKASKTLDFLNLRACSNPPTSLEKSRSKSEYDLSKLHGIQRSEGDHDANSDSNDVIDGQSETHKSCKALTDQSEQTADSPSEKRNRNTYSCRKNSNKSMASNMQNSDSSGLFSSQTTSSSERTLHLSDRRPSVPTCDKTELKPTDRPKSMMERSSQDYLIRHSHHINRSQSDLHRQHSRNSSDMSDLSSRVSRASTELERFFNEMGLDKSVLDPMAQDVHTSDMDLYDTISASLDSPDVRSVCSELSQSDREHFESELAEKSPSHTSVVERNARIIKWLCNVRKAKAPPSGT